MTVNTLAGAGTELYVYVKYSCSSRFMRIRVNHAMHLIAQL
jgi:hypothetical protein